MNFYYSPNTIVYYLCINLFDLPTNPMKQVSLWSSNMETEAESQYLAQWYISNKQDSKDLKHNLLHLV